MMEKGVTVQQTEYDAPRIVRRWWSDEEILDLFPDEEGSICNRLLRRAQKAEEDLENLQEAIKLHRKDVWGDDVVDHPSDEELYAWLS